MAIINIKLTLDGDQFVAQAGRIEGATNEMSGKVDASFESATAKVVGFSFAFNQVLDVATRVADAMVAPIAKFAEFETSMANVASLGVANIGEMKTEILNLAKEVPVPLASLTAGMYEVVSAGVSANDQISFLAATAKAAKAGLAETTDAINLSAAVIKGYGLEWSATNEVLDMAFQTVKLGQTTFPQLAASMGQTIPIASALRVSTRELFGAYATLTGVTGNTSEVSTQLKAVMTGLAAPTKELSELVREHGSASVESLVAQQGLAGVLKILQEETGGSASKMTELFGSVEAVNALLALTGSQAGSFAEKTKEMAESAGVMNAALSEQTNTIESAAQAFQNQLDVRIVQVMESLRPLINGVVQFGTSLLQINWTPFIAGASAAAAAVAAIGIAKIITDLGGLIPALQLAQAAVITFAGTTTAAISSIPIIGWIAAAITALGALTVAIIASAEDEAELAEERKRTAQETVNIIDAEIRRVEQSVKTDGATEGSTEKLRLMNDELLRQQRIINDANITIYRQQLEDATGDIHDLHQGIVDAFDRTGRRTRELFTRFGDDMVAMQQHVNVELDDIIVRRSESELGLRKLSTQELEWLNDEAETLREIKKHLDPASEAQKKLNAELENRQRLLQGSGATTLEEQVTVNTTVNALGRKAPKLAPLKPIVELEEITAADVIPENMKLGPTLEQNFGEMETRYKSMLEANIISEEEFYQKRIALAERFLELQTEFYGAESTKALEAAAAKVRIEEEYTRKKGELQRRTTQQFLQLSANLMTTFQGQSEFLFGIGKGMAIAQAVVDTYAGANKALAAYPPPFGAIAAAIVVATGLANVAKITATKFERKQEGGFLGDEIRTLGAGDFGSGEDRMIIANTGEFIVNREATARNRALLELINRSERPVTIVQTPGFQQGGVVGAGGGGIMDVDRIVDAIRNVNIVIESKMDAIQFLRKYQPEFDRLENIRRAAI